MTNMRNNKEQYVMNRSYYTVAQIASILAVHPKTVQRYIREGKLHAAKIGKSWRVDGHDLSLFVESWDQAGGLAGRGPYDAARGGLRVKISSVIDIENVNSDDAAHIVNNLNAALNTKPPEYGRSSMHTQYLEETDTVRITLWGNIAFIGAMLDFIAALTKQPDCEVSSYGK
jgi:excisionase family DNA binding protein